MKTRHQKIKLLKDLQAGKTTVKDSLLEPITGIRVVHNGTVFKYGLDGMVPEMPVDRYEEEHGPVPIVNNCKKQ